MRFPERRPALRAGKKEFFTSDFLFPQIAIQDKHAGRQLPPIAGKLNPAVERDQRGGWDKLLDERDPKMRNGQHLLGIKTGMFKLLGVTIVPIFRAPSNPFIADLVRRVQRAGELLPPPDDARRFEPTSLVARLFEQGVETAALHVLHREEAHGALRRPRVVQSVDTGDIGMVQRGQQFRLALQAGEAATALSVDATAWTCWSARAPTSAGRSTRT